MFKLKKMLKIGVLTLITLFSAVCGSYAQTSEDEALKKGIDYGRHDKYDEAITEFDNAIKINPNSANTYYDRGVIYDKKGDLDQAILDFSKAIEIDPNLTDAYYNRGFDYYKRGDSEKAISDYNKVIELSPNSVDAYYGRGLVYSKTGNLEQAISDYDKAIEIRPNFALAYDARAIAYFTKKNYVQTMADVNKAQSLGFKSRPLKRASPNSINRGESVARPSEQASAKETKMGLVKIIILSLAIILGVCLFVFFSLRKIINSKRPI